MLKVDIGEHRGGDTHCSILAQGTLIEITADVGQVIAGVHMQLKRSNPVMARIYRRKMIELLTDPDTPLWNVDPNAEGVMITIPKFKEET